MYIYRDKWYLNMPETLRRAFNESTFGTGCYRSPEPCGIFSPIENMPTYVLGLTLLFLLFLAYFNVTFTLIVENV